MWIWNHTGFKIVIFCCKIAFYPLSLAALYTVAAAAPCYARHTSKIRTNTSPLSFRKSYVRTNRALYTGHMTADLDTCPGQSKWRMVRSMLGLHLLLAFRGSLGPSVSRRMHRGFWWFWCPDRQYCRFFQGTLPVFWFLVPVEELKLVVLKGGKISLE